MRIHIINGPNLNMLGKREPDIYGTFTLTDLEKTIRETFPGTEIAFFQSNHEGEIIDYLQSLWGQEHTGLIINAGAFSHYSYAIHDALKMLAFPKTEVHLSNIYQREAFRAHSVLSSVCDGVIAGLGINGYLLGVSDLIMKLKNG
ncbi:MAG: type II 3-dehydroquinate dehydratase [Bacteroidia bacterium]|nr:type II 3-dehydroquinate dehydratase [Bacteroidia bacterium]